MTKSGKKLDIRITEGRFSLSPTAFEYLLNCLANQKFTDELMPRSQLSEFPNFSGPTREEVQSIIDIAWRQGMSILSEYQQSLINRNNK